jgi:amidohydrolase
MSSQKKTDALKNAIREAAQRRLPEFMEMVRWLYRNPELSGEEKESSKRLAEILRRSGFDVTFGVGELPTAFVARRRRGKGPVLAYLAEYDALPDIGHGCGHNLIGTAAMGAALILDEVAPDLRGEIRVLGTPAEETLGGKVVMVEAGVFADVDAALMVHPASEDRVLSDSLACQSLEVVYRGRAAHAVAHPDKGINALDPLLALFAARDALTRQSRTGLRIVGVILEGGVRPNVIPERAVGQFSLRAPDRERLAAALSGFRRHARQLAASYGCEVELTLTDLAYDEMLTNLALADAYRANLAALGVEVNDAPREHMGSLDMGNVSKAVPSLHPFFALVPAGLASHTREFAQATITEAGEAGLLRSVQALAMTGLDVLSDPDLLHRAREEHTRSGRSKA